MLLGNALTLMMQFSFLLLLIIGFAFKILLVHGQHKDFISIDCGAVEEYADATTTIQYVPDSDFVKTGVPKQIAASYKTNSLEKQFNSVRSFPQGKKNCYTLTPHLVNGSEYLVRARFKYGNYDLTNQVPQFDLYVGVNFWTTVKFDNESSLVTKEIVNVSSSNLSYVCLVNTGGGTPFISLLELRPLNPGVYVSDSEYGSLELHSRWNMGSSNRYRYRDDIFDRIWEPFGNWDSEVESESTDGTIGGYERGRYDYPPSIVMRTSVTPADISSGSIDFHWKPDNPTDQYLLYFHFSDFQQTQGTNQSREIQIYINDQGPWNSVPIKPSYLGILTCYSSKVESHDWFNISIRQASSSTLPPIFNAFEALTVRNLSSVGTNQADVDALKKISTTYELNKDWQGDPCVPQEFSWEEVNCSNAGDKPNDNPRITVLNLSSSGLSGEISLYLQELASLEYLDMSNNRLTGPVPDFISDMTSLKSLNLSGNKLTGLVPSALLKRQNTNLTLRLENNPGLCTSPDTCKESKKQNKTVIFIAVVASVFGVIIITILAAVVWRSIKKRKQASIGGNDRGLDPGTATPEHEIVMVTLETKTNKQYSLLKSENQRFAITDVLSITNNFERAIGKGGFGTVYYGCIDDTQVAVKMLSSSSIQGYKQFHAEAKLLMRVHHRNLTSLIGFCEEGSKLGLIYEYMPKGDLRSHLSANNPQHLSWEARLSIALDAANGLEYLHYGCKPPIIHRDVKSTNILLNESFQAKLSDFGLSKIFPTESKAGLSTTVAGTPGYLDPEYCSSHLLSEKSDVYSYGVVLLEIITGQLPITKNNESNHISETVKTKLHSSGDIALIVDPRLREDFDKNSAWKAVEVAMACVSSPSTRRPNMKQIVIELQQCVAMENARLNGTHHGTETMDSTEKSSPNITTKMTPEAR